jgi:hypothetical protein
MRRAEDECLGHAGNHPPGTEVDAHDRVLTHSMRFGDESVVADAKGIYSTEVG